MPSDPDRVEEIFTQALGKAGADARAAYLHEACGADTQLRQRVESLLAAHEATANFIPLPPVNPATEPFQPLSEGPGTKIGRYKLLQQIGEGGFGVVFMAEQQHPVRRRVALKIIKLGMDTRQVVARFEAERQALAMMDHPNVAKVLDAGATETGRPYFVMELVKGVPITEYCDKNNLSIPRRLEIFAQVCQAVQHAHQKGLIHRDIKPSNVLVNTLDDRPVAKVIDFGIAKATQSRLTDKTLFTEFQQLVGTPQYMSPEQAEGSLDVDTRSDVYSLGVLLYELLTGTTPFDARELRSKAYGEIQRIIREVEPPRPSTRLNTMKETLPTVALHRAIEPRKLDALIRGELDWIVMKCLEKDRARRYETANGLVMDLHRYLADEAVLACPPSTRYRLGKFVRRHRAALGIAAAFAGILVLGAVMSTWQAVRARRAERVAVTERAAAVEARNLALASGKREADLRVLAESRGEQLRRNLYHSEMSLAGQAAVLPGGIGRVREMLGTWNGSQPDLRNWEWYYLNALCHRDLVTIAAHDQTNCIAWSPDSSLLASAGMDRTVKIWESATGKHRQTFIGHTDQVFAVAWSPDGTRLASGSADRTLRIWDASTGRELLRFAGGERTVRSVTWSPDSTRVAAGSGDGAVRIWDLRGGRAGGTSVSPAHHQRSLRDLESVLEPRRSPHGFVCSY